MASNKLKPIFRDEDVLRLLNLCSEEQQDSDGSSDISTTQSVTPSIILDVNKDPQIITSLQTTQCSLMAENGTIIDTHTDPIVDNISQNIGSEVTIQTRVEGETLQDESDGDDSNNDHDYNPSSSSTESSTADESVDQPTRKRRKKPQPEIWKINKSKIKRLSGEKHTSRRGIQREEKKIKSRCESNFCRKSKLRNCDMVTDDDRQWIFENFWKMKSWDERKSVVKTLIETVEKKLKKCNKNDNKREHSYKYNLKCADGKIVQVCKKMFCSTLGMPDRTINDWLHETVQVSLPGPSKEETRGGPTRKVSTDENKFLTEWLLNVPCVDSHYCRKSSAYKDKRFLEPGTKIVHFHDLYTQDAKKADTRAVGLTFFKNRFEKLNMSVFSPRKDQCDLCISAKMGHVSAEELQRHLDAKEKAQTEKSADKGKGSEDDSVSVWSMDAQGVLLCPSTKASALYYRTKMQVHNFTLHEMIKNDGYCFVWDETDGSLSSEVFSYIQYSHFKSFLEANPQVKTLIIWSDGCSYQNKNTQLSNAYCQLSLEKDITIFQKYLVVGHTHMECDAMHSTIERNLKTDIFTPRDLVVCMQTARRNPRPYIVKQLSYTDFKKMSEVRFNTIRPGKKVGFPTVNEISAIKYINGHIFYKLFHNDNDWRSLPTRIAFINPHPIWEPLFPNRRPISDRKFRDLQFMKKVMPNQVHAYFDELPHE